MTVLPIVTINSEDYDHGRIVAGLDALQECIERIVLEEDYEEGDSINRESLQGCSIKQIFDTARIEAKED